jgi:hypothetical protein
MIAGPDPVDMRLLDDWQRDLPLLGINHIEGHVRSVFIEHPEIEFPAMALIVSGGHTELVLMRAHLTYERLGGTLDDAAGEAFSRLRARGIGAAEGARSALDADRLLDAVGSAVKLDPRAGGVSVTGRVLGVGGEVAASLKRLADGAGGLP